VQAGLLAWHVNIGTFTNMRKLILASDTGTGFRQMKMWHVYSWLTFAFWPCFEIEVSLFAAYHGFSRADNHAGEIGGLIAEHGAMGRVRGAVQIAALINDLKRANTVAYAHEDPHHYCLQIAGQPEINVVTLVETTHESPCRDALVSQLHSVSMHFRQGDEEHCVPGVVLASKLSGLPRHQMLVDMRKAERKQYCAECSNHALYPVRKHPGRNWHCGGPTNEAASTSPTTLPEPMRVNEQAAIVLAQIAPALDPRPPAAKDTKKKKAAAQKRKAAEPEEKVEVPEEETKKSKKKKRVIK
jgi:hypothetical protein